MSTTEQQWQRQTVVNGPPMSGDLMNVQLAELPRAPPAQPPPRARYFRSTQTDHEEVTDLVGTDP